MQDFKRHATRRAPYRKQRSSSITLHKRQGRTFIRARSRLKEDASLANSGFFLFFKFFKKKQNSNEFVIQAKGLGSKLIGVSILIVMLWLGGGTAYLGWKYFQMPLKMIEVSGNQLLSSKEVLQLSGLKPGVLLSELDPFLMSSRIQLHPIVHRADVRREFPNSVHLMIHEHKPEILVKKNHKRKDSYWLVNRDHLVLKAVEGLQSNDPVFSQFPKIKGLPDQGVRPGVLWDSLALERGMNFLRNVNEWDNRLNQLTLSTGNEKVIHTEGLLAKKILMLDLTDPMNLKMLWQLPNQKKNYVEGSVVEYSSSQSSVVVNLGRDKYPQKLKLFGEILSHLLKEHPEIKSLDLRYSDRVTLVP